MKQVNIYALINPINQQVFYIGATIQDPKYRLMSHINEGRNYLLWGTLKTKLIHELCAAGQPPEILVLDSVQPSEASFYELFYIHLFKSYGFTLLQSFKSSYTKVFKSGFKGKNKPKNKSLDKIAKALDCDLEIDLEPKP